MYDFQKLIFTRVMPRADGIFVFAKYPQWRYEYNFLVQPDGTVKGKTQSGLWLELGQELAVFVCEKVKFILKEESGRIYN
jgi:hypothetical protein